MSIKKYSCFLVFLILTSCQKAIEDNSNILEFEAGTVSKSLLIKPSDNPLGNKKNSKAKFEYKNCTTVADVVLGGKPYDIEDQSESSNEIRLLLRSGTEKNEITCGLNELRQVERATFNKSRMSPTVLPVKALISSQFSRILDLPHRAYTSPTKDRGIIKYFSQFNFQATSRGNYCVEYTYKAEDDRRNSIFLGFEKEEMSPINLPVTGSVKGSTIITSPNLHIYDTNKVFTVRIKHRENVTSYGIRLLPCPENNK